ncbi:hypothetical protein ACFP3I_12040 [Chryseobacterium arachidis]|uniref:hypothetical protein n=1 Tax=Chryseobacterium arachidis TaxID=1416778 RepID=UPI003615E4C1
MITRHPFNSIYQKNHNQHIHLHLVEKAKSKLLPLNRSVKVHIKWASPYTLFKSI